MGKRMDHNEYPRRLRGLEREALEFIVKDAMEAIACLPGVDNASYYADEVHYAAAELARRNRRERVRQYA